MMWNEKAGGDETAGVAKQSNVAASSDDDGNVTKGAELGNVIGSPAGSPHPVFASAHWPERRGNGDWVCRRCQRLLWKASGEAAVTMPAVCYLVPVVPMAPNSPQMVRFSHPRTVFVPMCYDAQEVSAGVKRVTGFLDFRPGSK